MRLTEEEETLVFSTDDGRLAGRYAYDDPFKPSLHPLTTPGGLTVSAFMPHDHKHHRALMYALRTPDINFWEERHTRPEEVVGRQAHQGFENIVSQGEQVGFTQRLLWSAADGSLPTFAERRSVSCRLGPDGGAFQWEWSTKIEALRDTELVMSQWSAPRSDGALVNYHGLGVRLPREFGGSMAKAKLRLDDSPCEVAAALGSIPRLIEYAAAVDGFWPVRHAGLRIGQAQPNALFILKEPFAYLSLGPSNLAPRQMRRGETLAENYRIEVFDGPTEPQ
jgi:hypothetical protein